MYRVFGGDKLISISVYDIIPLGEGGGYLKLTPTILSPLWGTYGTVSRTPDYKVIEDVT